jgi:opacity protein-like surface antigen
MQKFFKTAIVAIALTMTAVTANAQQKGDMAWGVQGAFTSLEGYPDNVSFIGLGAKFRYNVTNPIRLEGAFTYFLPKDEMSLWDFSADAQWLFPVSDKITLYPAAGLGIYGVKIDMGGFGNASGSEFGLNLGGGADFRISEKTAITTQLKYGTAIDRIVLSAGVAFNL